MNRQYSRIGIQYNSRVAIQAYGSYSHQSMKNSDLPQYQIQQSRSTPTSLGMGKLAIMNYAVYNHVNGPECIYAPVTFQGRFMPCVLY